MTASAMAKKDHWSTEAYSSSASFVPLLTKRVVSLLDPQPTDSILDIGCGDGALTIQLAAKCHKVVGLDASPAFVRAARAKAEKDGVVGKVDFFERDCRRLEAGSHIAEGIVLQNGQFDRVFSNATLHWVLRDEGTRKLFFSDVYALIRPGGCFVFEMGGAGNVAEVHTALVAVLHLRFKLPMASIHAADPWFFPSEDWVRDVLAEAGFKDVLLETEYRPTKLDPTDSRGDGGLAGWVRLMGAAYLDLLASEEERVEAIEKVVEVLKSAVTREDGSQWLGYLRLRAKAWVR